MLVLLSLNAILWVLSMITTVVLLWQSHPKTAISFAVLFATTATLVAGILAELLSRP